MGTPISEKNVYENPASRVMEPGPLSEAKPKGDWRDYVSVTKLGIVVSNLMSLFAGVWLAADGPLPVPTVLMAMLGSALVIMSGTCLNNYIDRDLDKLMARTKSRALPEGRVNPQTVMIMGFVFGIAGTITLLLINTLTAVLGLVGLVFYVVVYTMWTKRTTTLNTLVGGISGAMPPMMGYAAISGTIDMTAWVLFGILFIWQCPHFLALAMRRADDYRAAGFQMLPAVRGFAVTKRHILRYTAALVLVSIMLYALGKVGMVYLIGMSILGIGYVIINMTGFFAKDDIKFARKSFVYSLVYLMLFTILVLIDRV
ncbi:heme o synthase [Aneurinibacillus aneurinilyticus]|jgi:protoheme IX farnesyltransferase|nr:heme o synthase [Aneurinibacillus aneurinilyticus]MCI1694386.1 heme o synthase [Aneurinibacillus aneurinilyticus]MED0706513.1 heme o synthase [Aneurinibacillus aneurinilyticus]MED0724422.1 heme o synthase [Aneurinibacillus aneurinilyticus]MED0730523.1 heme o synthase [Aneurinibacillus aneurinilyticus]MED0742565.1 heme o synthase [Aneurinibacillus aneurinilyticus]